MSQLMSMRSKVQVVPRVQLQVVCGAAEMTLSHWAQPRSSVHHNAGVPRKVPKCFSFGLRRRYQRPDPETVVGFVFHQRL